MNAGREVLDYRDLESELLDALNMSDLTCRLVENAGAANDKGQVVVTDHEWNAVLFAVNHSFALLHKLRRGWEEIHDDNVPAKKGGAK